MVKVKVIGLLIRSRSHSKRIMGNMLIRSRSRSYMAGGQTATWLPWCHNMCGAQICGAMVPKYVVPGFIGLVGFPMWCHNMCGAQMCGAQICGAVVPVGARDFPEISRDLEGYSPRFDDVTKVEDWVKVKVKAEVKYAKEGRHIGILRHPWPLIG